MELRKDYILDRWVIISEARAKRPKQFEDVKQQKEIGTCFFCPGNEGNTPPEIGRLAENDKWTIRWFPNKFPASSKEGKPEIEKDMFFTHGAAYGSHEVIAETPDHDKQLADLTVDHLAKILKVYSNRIVELSKEAKYVLVFKNQGEAAGTSIIHTHTQVVSLNLVPPLVTDEVKAARKFKSCPYCEIIKKEKQSARFIFENASFVAIAPYASRFNYEAWILPRKHMKSITEFSEQEFKECAELLHKILAKLASIQADYNFVLHYSPKKADLHFHIELLPRIANWAGFEFLSNIIINSMPPEKAAEFYKSG
ncbi:MAG: galactose-1-phosphate uridylyltransferase [Candidatus Woesearchaeota archaeon]